MHTHATPIPSFCVLCVCFYVHQPSNARLTWTMVVLCVSEALRDRNNDDLCVGGWGQAKEVS